MNQQAIWKRCLAIFDNNNVIGVHLIMGAIACFFPNYSNITLIFYYGKE